MFGCSDVYHWMGRTAKAVCLPDAFQRNEVHLSVRTKHVARG